MLLFLGTFFTITGGDMATITSYTGDLFSDFFPLIAIVISIFLLGLLWRNFTHKG